MTIVGILPRLLALAVGLIAGLACGAATMPRSRPHDGSDGALARWARGEGGASRIDGGGAYGGDAYGGGAYGGGAYGGGAYGGGAYGGYGGGGYGGGAYGNSYTGEEDFAYGGLLYGNVPGVEFGRVGDFTPPPRRPRPAPTLPDYTAGPVTDGGTIEGLLIGRAPADLAHPEPIGVVWLEGIRRGVDAVPQGGTLELRAGRAWPRVQVVAPIGAAVRFINGDDAPHTLALVEQAREPHARAFALPPRAQRELPLDHPGIHAVTETGHARALAWLVVAAHPYHVITDALGAFRLTDVPPGAYTLVAWRPPASGAAPKFVRTRIVVAPHGLLRVRVVHAAAP